VSSTPKRRYLYESGGHSHTSSTPPIATSSGTDGQSPGAAMLNTALATVKNKVTIAECQRQTPMIAGST
jgi:hypothetical protein